MKTSSVGVELFLAYRQQADVTKLIADFLNFVEAPNVRPTFMSSAGSEPPIPEIQRLQTYALDRRNGHRDRDLVSLGRLKHESSSE